MNKPRIYCSRDVIYCGAVLVGVERVLRIRDEKGLLVSNNRQVRLDVDVGEEPVVAIAEHDGCTVGGVDVAESQGRMRTHATQLYLGGNVGGRSRKNLLT